MIAPFSQMLITAKEGCYSKAYRPHTRGAKSRYAAYIIRGIASLYLFSLPLVDLSYRFFFKGDRLKVQKRTVAQGGNIMLLIYGQITACILLCRLPLKPCDDLN